ncbi:pyridoxal phosphate-dependent aminotransferase [Siansivirga zeaxanthinifaciens]|uniref:Histidinol phosphate aminotransferase n=1 Tax=Siansivirga zeaxanthinifaciens CC-SAMT-1 TaxID=1454006 RepID=A0A0C5WAV3_9FLAO|nr:histidinol-phosphate transaminase [Siansivirga zeaxanthinifaciens]AJR04223.1 histidinol phosphate aminotransferase [Siansivirga zeaxanthinifaciens CC-SAMT-1]
MKNTHISRRHWLKRGTLTLAGMAMMPSEIWAESVKLAQLENRNLVFSTDNCFNEFTPPSLFDPKLKAILRANENPYGPPPLAAKAFQDDVFSGNRYAWETLTNLVNIIAKKENVTPEQILMAPGSSDVLEKVAMVFFQKGGDVISADPSYMSLMQVSQSVGGKWKSYKLLPDSQHDLDAMEAGIDANTKLVYICNPNNPTGSITDAKKLKEFCSRVSEKVPVFVDEAYIELSDNGIKDSMVDLVSAGKNVMIARTFSKIHGMAGLRIGYLLGSEATIESINRVTRGGMGLTGPSIMAATTSLQHDEFLTMSKTKIAEARAYTQAYLTKNNFAFLPSQTNFIIFEIPMDGKEFLDKIYEKQVAVRAFTFWDKNWCRVSMGTMEEMALFTMAMDEIFA